MIIRPSHPARRGIRGTIDDNIISFINVIFLILIFFMIAGKIEKPTVFRVDPPDSMSEAPRGDQGIVILLGTDGRVAIDNVVVDRAQLMARLGAAANASVTPEIEVRADAGVDMARFKGLLADLGEAGVSRVRLLAATR